MFTSVFAGVGAALGLMLLAEGAVAVWWPDVTGGPLIAGGLMLFVVGLAAVALADRMPTTVTPRAEVD